VRAADGAGDAAAEIAGHPGTSVLVIDSGLLHMPHDAQWRLLRARHPSLGVVVRCLIASSPGLEEEDAGTFRVHPDHRQGLLRAVRILGARATSA
jgi:hypothetical protein